MLHVFDLSHYQGAENFPAMKSAFGLSMCYVKATQGESYMDSRLVANWRGMTDANLVRGAYNFAEPDNTARDDVAALLSFVKSAGPLHPTDVFVLDLESSSLAAKATAQWAHEWGTELRRQAPGYAPWLYCGGFMAASSSYSILSHNHGGPFARWIYPRYPNAYAGRAAWPTSYADLILPSLARSNWGGEPDGWQFSQSFPDTTEGGDPHDANVLNMTLDQLLTTNQGADMPLTDPEIAAIATKSADAVWVKILNGVGSDVRKMTAAQWLAVAVHDIDVDIAKDVDAGTHLDSISAAIDALKGIGGGTVDVDALAVKLRDALGTELLDALAARLTS
jgi:hypothetical protein